MTAATLRSVLLGSKGQVTLTSCARRQLGIEPGDTLIEIIIGGCVILMPEDRLLLDALRLAKQSMDKSGLKLDGLTDEIERYQAKSLTKESPELSS